MQLRRKRSVLPFLVGALIALALLPGCSPAGPEASGDFLPAVVTRCVDGDTVYVTLAGRTEKVRFIGINTPELRHPEKGAEPFGREAAAYTRSRLLGKRVYLEMDVQERDKYGRLLVYVWLSPPESRTEAEVRQKMFNAELLLNGYAQVLTIPPNVRYADMFVRLQREARAAQKGLWGGQSNSGH
ncbi:MAG: Nuclease (SNase domain protein) [Clostridia bacterium 62_21]|nr:MAG: Nuclease (SNase domain protein) [Clostridia bacterium 62_21]HAG07630.1 nuclease [Peptococcaceae bacterium]